MMRRTIVFNIALLLAIPLASRADAPKAPAALTAAQIVDKDVAAKGGLQAWRAVQTITYSGKMDAGGKQDTQLPFLMQMKRPHKTRMEIEFQNEKAIQVYDGSKGWKFRPFLGRRDVEPYSADELRAASVEPDLDGFLVDYAAKGTQVTLEGMEKVEGRDAYKLKLTMKGGQVRHLWVDAESFLDVKVEGTPARMDGKMRPVEVYFRDYKSINGLMFPYVLETTVQGNTKSHKMTIENVVVNPKLDDSLFTELKPK
jgi:outer membrane lipoprotein-sorting protein